MWLASILLFSNFVGTAHCANMYPELPSDPPELVQARLKIKEHIVNWLNG